MTIREAILNRLNQDKRVKVFDLETLDTAVVLSFNDDGRMEPEPHSIRARISELITDGTLRKTGTPGEYRRA
jgi:hypothetical protein